MNRFSTNFQKIKRLIAKQYLRMFTTKNYQDLVKAFSITHFESGEVLASKNGDKMFSIGSITKVMTTFMALDTVGDLENTELTVEEEGIYDPVKFSTAHLRVGETKTAKDLLEETMVISACDSAYLLGDYVYENKKLRNSIKDYIKRLDLRRTNLVDTTGENIENKMSSNDINLLTRKLVSEYPEIINIVSKPELKRLDKVFYSTFPKVEKSDGAKLIGIKTGYLKEAGRSFVFLLETSNNEKYIISLIGANRLIERDFVIEKLVDEYLSTNIKLKL